MCSFSFFWNLRCLFGSLQLRYVSPFVLFWLLLIVLIVHKGVSCLYFCMFTFFCFKLICCYPVLNSWSRVNEIPVFSLRSPLLFLIYNCGGYVCSILLKRYHLVQLIIMSEADDGAHYFLIYLKCMSLKLLVVVLVL